MSLERYVADFEGFRLRAFVSHTYNDWSVSIHRRQDDHRLDHHEPLMSTQNGEIAAKEEAKILAARHSGKKPSEIDLVWRREE